MGVQTSLQHTDLISFEHILVVKLLCHRTVLFLAFWVALILDNIYLKKKKCYHL
jgi:hypothetical protein